MRGGRNQQGATVDQGHHILGLITQSPLILLFLIIGLAIAVWIFTQSQITNTETSVLALLQAGTTITPGMTGRQVQQLMTGQMMGYYTGIAALIGWGVQIALVIMAFPPDSALLSLHRRFNADAAPSLVSSAMNQEKWRTIISRVLVGGDILTDFLYVVRGHTLFSGFNGMLPQLDWGVLIIGVMYPAVICFVTVFCLKYLLAFVEQLIDKLTPR